MEFSKLLIKQRALSTSLSERKIKLVNRSLREKFLPSAFDLSQRYFKKFAAFFHIRRSRRRECDFLSFVRGFIFLSVQRMSEEVITLGINRPLVPTNRWGPIPAIASATYARTEKAMAVRFWGCFSVARCGDTLSSHSPLLSFFFKVWLCATFQLQEYFYRG